MRNPGTLLEFFEGSLDESVSLLKELVELESGSLEKCSIDRLADFLAGELHARGAQAAIIPVAERGNIVKAEWKSGRAGKPVLVLGHMDTVWPGGTILKRPFQVTGGRAYGPGVFDMKGGLLLGALACEAFRQGMVDPGRDVVFLFTSDEEIGTEAGLPYLREAAAGCCAVLCLEPPLPGGGAKTFRKGVGELTVTVEGVPAHAGLDHEKGANAIVELARQLVRIQALTDYDRGLTISVGKIRGGSASNVVPAEAEAEIDFRVASLSDADWVKEQMRLLRLFDSRCTIRVRGGMTRPPLERTPAVVGLFQIARAVAREFGMNLAEGSSGGGSDGSLTAAMGIPTLDGLGVDGDGAHAENEHVIVADIPRRAALISRLLQSLGNDTIEAAGGTGSR